MIGLYCTRPGQGEPTPQKLPESQFTKNESAQTPVRVLGRLSNSPPPKTAHCQATFRPALGEWLRRAEGGTGGLLTRRCIFKVSKGAALAKESAIRRD